MDSHSCNTLVIGAGIVGVSAAYYLKRTQPDLDIILVDCAQPMSFTSAQSGENYRNWWPHPVMTAFTDHSIDLMEAISHDTDNRINMTRRGYVLASRSSNTDAILNELNIGYAEQLNNDIRVHNQTHAPDY